jgi:SAM-dependent methyltransferase
MTQPPSNQEQIDYWNGPGAQRWVNQQQRLDRALGAFDAIGQATVAALPGERALDVGCGCGASTLQLADAVGPGGAVLAVDVSGPMLARARERGHDRPWITWLQADAATHTFEREFDVLYSRFGWMFFEAPIAALANLHAALRLGGRLCFLCWRAPDQNPWFSVPMSVAKGLLPPQPEAAPEAPGPFAFGQAARARAVLSDAGFTQIEIEPADAMFTLSTHGLDEAIDFVVQAGPLSRMLVDASASTLTAVQRALATVLAPYVRGERVEMPAGLWVVTARGVTERTSTPP